MRAGKIEGVTTPNQNQGTSPWYFCCIFISHFYRGYKYYFFSLKFCYEHSEIPTNFCFHDLLYFQNNECKKNNSKFEREVKSNGNTLLPHRIFFSFTRFFLWTLRKIHYFFFYAFSVFLEYAKKNSKFEREVKTNGNTLPPHNFFLFLSLDCSYEQSERFPTIFSHAL